MTQKIRCPERVVAKKGGKKKNEELFGDGCDEARGG